MVLPPNLPAKGFGPNLKQYAHVKPFNPDVPADRIEAAKQRICAREAAVVARIQANAREKISRLKATVQRSHKRGLTKSRR